MAPDLDPRDTPLEDVLADGLLGQIPHLSNRTAHRIAGALAYDLYATGWVTRQPPDRAGSHRVT